MRFAALTFVACLLAFVAFCWQTGDRSALADVDDSPPVEAKPVEDDMHEFMEYVFQPPYKRLKASLAEAPADKNAWKAIKSDSLILAESANLLLSRAPTRDSQDWIAHATGVRVAGTDFYQAAKKQDYRATRVTFAMMLNKCNACHEQFEDGKHILEP